MLISELRERTRGVSDSAIDAAPRRAETAFFSAKGNPMRKSAFLFLVAAAGCGGSGTHTLGGDMAARRDLAMPASPADMTVSPDLAQPAGPVPVLAGDYTLDSVTDDGYAAVHDTMSVFAVELATGKMTKVGPFTP